MNTTELSKSAPNAAAASVDVVLIEGDGIGPEITAAVVEILSAAGAAIAWKPAVVGLKAIEQSGEPLPQAVIDLIARTKLALKAPVATPIGRGDSKATSFRSVNVELRKALDLYANVRPTRLMPGVKTRFAAVDLVFIRENTEGLYSGLEHEITEGVVTSLKVATAKACTRIAEYAFAYAKRNGRRKITGVHKANIMKLSDGLALDCYRAVAQRYPEIGYEEKIVDATAMSLVMDPTKFDVLLMENLYGDILSDLGAGLIGGLGLAPSANIGAHGAMFEAVHGSAPDIAGKGIANPTALLLSAVEMLKHISQIRPAERIETALDAIFREGKETTADLGGKASTKQFTQAVIARLDQ